MTKNITASQISAVYENLIKHKVHETPIQESDLISTIANENQSHCKNKDIRLFFKSEHLQKTGSYKIRGALNAISNSKANTIITNSSGNHAQAISLASKMLNKQAIVVMPENCQEKNINAIENTYGGKVIKCEQTQEAREQTTKKTLEEFKKRHGKDSIEEIQSNQNLDAVIGNGTIAVEFFQQMKEMGEKLDAVIISVRGGGMIAGMSTYIKEKWPECLVIGADSDKSSGAQKALEPKKLVGNPSDVPINNKADSVKTSLGNITCPYMSKNVDKVYTATGEEISHAMHLFFERAKQVIESGCAVSVAIALGSELYKDFPHVKNIGVVLCGGNVDIYNLPWC